MIATNEDQTLPFQLDPSHGAGAACMMIEGWADAMCCTIWNCH